LPHNIIEGWTSMITSKSACLFMATITHTSVY